MNRINFEDAEIFFQGFLLGRLAPEIEFRGCFEKAVLDGFTSKNYAQINSNDIILRFSLKERSPQFQQLLQEPSPVNPSVKHLRSDFGTIKIESSDGITIRIREAFWTRYPLTEFTLKHNSENTIHSLYFLW